MKIERNLISDLNLIAVEDPILNHHLVSDVLDAVGHMLLDFALIQCQMGHVIDVTGMVMQQKTVMSIWELQILAECSKYNKIIFKTPEPLAEFLPLMELKLRSMIVLLEVFVLSLEHNYLYCLILGQPILLYLLIVLRNLSCQIEN